jgi:hypothetical protein
VIVASVADTVRARPPVVAVATASGTRCATRLSDTAPAAISFTVSRRAATTTKCRPACGKLSSRR